MPADPRPRGPPRPQATPASPPPARAPGAAATAAAAAGAAAGSAPTAETSRVPPSPDSTVEGHYAEGGDWNDWWQRASSAWDGGGRGLDAGLSKTAPTYELLKTEGYRVFRRKLEVFERCCRKRGTTAISEGAFLIMNSLQGEAAEATEDIDLDQLESEDAFKPLFQVLDEYYKYDNQTELPARTDQFFGKFARQDKETMKLYCLRHKRELRKLKEVGMEIPDMLAGWHLLSRAAVPPSGAAQVRSQCANGLSWISVKKALLDTYGAEAVPDKRDVKRVERMLVGQGHKDDVHYTNDYEWERGLSYEDSYLEEEEYDYDEYEEYDAEEYEEEADVAEELPQDVEEAQIACDEAYLSFVDAKRRVAEIAKSRGFYPIVAVAPDNNFQHGKGASRSAKPTGGKGKGRSKGKGKGKGTGSRQVFRPKVNIFNRPPTATPAGSTATGSTQQHGPRFKRFRGGGFVKPDSEHAAMVEDVETLEYANSTEEVYLMSTGKGISDGGATRPVMGDKIWAQWEELLRSRQLLHEVEYGKSDRRFRFGDGKTLEAKRSVTLNVWPFGVKKQITIHLVEGWTPLLIARPCMEEWGLVQDYRAGTFMMKDLPDKGWMKSERDEKGHFIIDLLGGAGRVTDDAMNEGAPTEGEPSSDDSTDNESEAPPSESEDDSESSDVDPDAYYLETVTEFYDISDNDDVGSERTQEFSVAGSSESARPSTMDPDTYTDLALALEQTYDGMKEMLRGPPPRKVWEVFVDAGGLSQALLEYPTVDVVQFRLEDGWDFSKPKVIKAFLRKIDVERPDDIFFAPPCKVWCSWQYVNASLSAERAAEIHEARVREEKTFLKLVRDSFVKQLNGGRHAYVEGPWSGAHWSTKTWKALPGHHCRLDQCRLGAKFPMKGVDMPYQKPTRLQSTNKEFVDHMGLRCECRGEHVTLRGKLAQQAQNYPAPMARRMAYLIAYQGMAADIDEIYTAEEVHKDIDAIEYTDVMQELLKRFNVSTIRAVKRAHVSLGHPSNAALANAMRHAGAPAEWIQCARLYQCEICLKRQRPRTARVAVLPKAKRFNEVVSTDVYYVTWKTKERKILAMMDEFTRYEVDYPIARETFKKEKKLFEKLWISWAGKPETMRMDMGGSHTSKKMHSWMSKHDIKLDLIPKGAHHKLGLMERNHAVRREQLSKYHMQFPDDSLKTTLRMTASQRNLLRNVHGFSPAMLVLGTQPRVPGALTDEDFGLAEQSALVDPRSEVHEMMLRRVAAGTAFIEANCSRAVRAALLARSRPTRREYEVGEWVYIWRPEPSRGLEKCHWFGPALAVAVEAKPNEDDVMHTSVVWATHGCVIYRCTVEQLRPELPGEAREREGRRDDPDSPLSLIEKLRRALKRTKGTCNYRDLAEEGQTPQYDDNLDHMGDQPQARGPDVQETDTEEPGEASGAAAAAAPEEAQPGDPGGVEAVDRDSPRSPAADAGAAASGSASSHAAPEPSRLHIETMAKRSVEEAEKLDGVPLSKRARLTWAKLNPPDEHATLLEEVDDEMLLLEESTETVYMLAFKRKAPTIVEGKLTPEEKEQFYAAKLEALEVFNQNDGWEPINEEDVDPAACCPLRFLLKWKMKDGQKVANARVLYQGFKHRDVAEGQLDKEAPTLSRLGRHTVMLWASLRKWRLFTADVKSAFLQAEDVSVRGLKLYASPTKEMREMLSQQIGLQPGQLLKMIKPCFGDPRSPKLRHYRSDEVTKEIGFRNHWLEDCLLLSLRPAKVEDDPFDVCSFEDQTYVVDGLIGKHVDDFIGCGEGVNCEDDLHTMLDNSECFQARLGALNQKFTFGKWDFGPSLIFTGGEVEQSLSTYAVTLKFEKYLHAVKPITIEKHRRADPTSALTPRELTSFRTLNGQLQWPAAQGVMIAAATVSFRAAATGNATVQDLLNANKDLRFLKANADVGLYFGFDKAWSELRVGGYSDASWASRLDGSSQGGYTIFVGPDDDLRNGNPTPFVGMEWASKKLVRLCRSSLSAEAQAAALGVDSLMWVKLYLTLSLRPDFKPDQAMLYLGESPFITDAKCLYDASRSATAGLGITEKRTAIEVKIVNEQMEEIGAVWKWVNTQQQMADGLTKLSARQQMADVLRRGVHALRYDPNFVAGKKLTKRAMEQREKELDQAGDDLADEFEAKPKEKPKQRKRHFGASGAKLAATLAASGASSAAGELMKYTPSGVELFNTPAPDDWSDLITKLLMLGIVICLILAFGCGFCAGVWWMHLTSKTTSADYKTLELETGQVPTRSTTAETATTGTSTKPIKQKKTRDMCCQAPTRYNLDLAQPRFQPLPEYAHGAFFS
ncbi:unnamed protein product [Prorocentrum cordatum]|uniref:Integrase catalytic domain-containing protein n=1 Tax=Prorocentrum cordatum TaxID=2364126 RepID=A0ABN9RCD9_9DINO|nr:unnamed protein product [Polarella glacialis]